MQITAKGLTARLPPEIESSVFRIPIDTPELAGEILILPREFDQVEYIEKRSLVSVLSDERRVAIPDELRRGGFLIGSIPGLPILRPRGTGGVLTLKTQPTSLRYRSTNVARTAAADNNSLALEVTQAWLQYLLENPTSIPADTLAEIMIYHEDDTRGGHVWDLPIDGVACFELGRLGWFVHPRWIEKWESGLVYALPIAGDPLGSGSGLLKLLLNRTLMHISDICVGRRAHYVRSPDREWRKRLAANTLRTIVADDSRRWGLFKPYSKSINHILAYQPGSGDRNVAQYLSFFNEQFSNRLASFDDTQIEELLSILDGLIDRLRRQEPIRLSTAQWELLTRLKDVAGELLIGWLGKSYPLKDLFA
jgi:hypothetical protein